MLLFERKIEIDKLRESEKKRVCQENWRCDGIQREKDSSSQNLNSVSRVRFPCR